MFGNFCVAEQLAASPEGLGSVKINSNGINVIVCTESTELVVMFHSSQQSANRKYVPHLKAPC
jgi:hypothetical protein